MISQNKDNSDLESTTVDEKFKLIVNLLNDFAFNRNGQVTMTSKRSFNLYDQHSNQIIQFHYSTGHLTITWRYKYFQKEVVLEKQFNNVRNLSLFEQENIAKRMISEMTVIVEKHKRNTLN
jgi:hypothetical protein